MADETFSTELELTLDTRRALAQLAAFSRKMRGLLGGAGIGPIAGGIGGRGVGVSSAEKRKARADLLLAQNTELAATRMARAAAALNVPGGRGGGRGPTNFARFGRNAAQGLNTAAQNTRGLSLAGAAAGVGSLYAYGRFQSQSIGLAAPIVGASKGTIGFRQALELSRRKYIPALDKFAAQTPFTLGGDIIPAATTGMNFGLQRKNTPESVAEMVRMLGNMQVATGNRRTMADLGVILGKGASRGKFEGEEMLQLAEAGINIEEIMREIGGKTLAKFEKGGLAAVYGTDADKMLEAIRIIYLDASKKGGLVKELSTTLPGATSTFADAVDRFGRRVGKSAEDRFGISGMILGTADSLNNASQEVVDAFGPLAGFASGVSLTLKTLGVTLQGAVLGIGGLIAARGLAADAGVGFLTGAVVDQAANDKFNNRKGFKGSVGRALLGGLLVSRVATGGLLGAGLGYSAANSFGFDGVAGASIGASLGSMALPLLGGGAGALTGSAGGTFVPFLAKAAAGLGLVAGSAKLAASGLDLLDQSAERKFQSGQGTHWADNAALWFQSNVLRASDDRFRQGGDVRGDRLQVEIFDRRVVLERENKKTNELISIPIGSPYGEMVP